MRSLSFSFAACCFTAVACTADRATAPSTLPSSGAPSVASGEGAEASAAAHLDLRDVRAELLAVDRAYAEAARSVNLIDALVAPLAPDVVFLAPGPVILRGPDAARALLSATPGNALSKWSWTPIRGDVSSDGKEGYTMGYTELTQPSGTVLPGRYVAYWAKQADGTWKVEAYKRIPRAQGVVSLTPPPGFETPTTKHSRYFPNTDAVSEAAGAGAADRAFSDLAQVVGNGEAFARYAAPTGAQSGNSESVGWVFGPAAIGETHADDPLGVFNWAPEIARAASSGDLAFTVGWVYNSEGQALGKYFSVWQKQNTGAWRYIVD